MSFPTLDELAQGTDAIDVSEYGLKTEGLVTLMRIQPEFAAKESEFDRFNFQVPAGFVVPTSADLEDRTQIDSLRESYFQLLEDQDCSSPFILSSLFRVS